MKKLLIAIDFDKTWTEDPEFWQEVVSIGRKRGHDFIIATGRRECSGDMEKYNLCENIDIVYCGSEYKEKACLNAGYKVDVWIDDMPMMIQQGLVISKDEEL